MAYRGYTQAQKEWQAANTTRLTFRFQNSTDADILEWMEAKPNKLGYLKDLIRADIEKNKSSRSSQA